MTKSLHEEWRPVVGFEGLYEVSSQGRVKSLARKNSQGRRVPERILKPGWSRLGGYLFVVLCRSGSKAARRVHRLVCEAFHGAAPKGQPHVLHGNSDTADNRAENLRWGSHAENMEDMAKAGRQSRRGGPGKILSDQEVLQVFSLAFDFFYSQQEIAAMLGVKEVTIDRAFRGATPRYRALRDLRDRWTLHPT